MSPNQSSTIEHLAAAFGRCQEEIIDEWRSQAGELLRERHLDLLCDVAIAVVLSLQHTCWSSKPGQDQFRHLTA